MTRIVSPQSIVQNVFHVPRTERPARCEPSSFQGDRDRGKRVAKV